MRILQMGKAQAWEGLLARNTESMTMCPGSILRHPQGKEEVHSPEKKRRACSELVARSSWNSNGSCLKRLALPYSANATHLWLLRLANGEPLIATGMWYLGDWISTAAWVNHSGGCGLGCDTLVSPTVWHRNMMWPGKRWSSDDECCTVGP